MAHYIQSSAWKSCHAHEPRLYGSCPLCGKRVLKRGVYTLYVRRPYGEAARTWCHVCEDCIAELADRTETPIP